MNKNISLLILVLSMILASCSGNVKINVNFSDHAFDGKQAFLTNYDTGDTIDSATVVEKKLVFEEAVDTAYYARLIVDGKRFGMIVEPGEINVEWGEETIIASGTPLNDKLNDINSEFGKLEEDWEKIGEELKNEDIDEDEANRRNEELEKKQIELFHKCYTENKDNAIGVWAFTNYLIYKQFNLAQIDSIFKTAPANYLEFKRVKKAKADAQAIENTAEGKKFADFEMKTSDGKVEKLSDFVGKDGNYTLVDFWASWCGPCRKEIKGALMQLYEKYNGKGLQIIGVAVWDKPEDTKAAIEQLKIPWHVMIGDRYMTEQTDLYGIAGIPHIMLIDSDGTIVMRGLQGDELVAAVEKALKGK